MNIAKSIFCFLLPLACVQAAEVVVLEKYDNGIIQKSFRGEMREGSPLNGELLLFDHEGKLVESSGFVNGSKGPSVTSYYPSGIVESRWQYSDGKANGVATVWYESGLVRSVGEYKDGVQHGRYQVFHEDGRIYLIGRCFEGVKVGRWCVYHRNGKLAVESEYDQSGKEVLASYFDEDGRTIEPKRKIK